MLRPDLTHECSENLSAQGCVLQSSPAEEKPTGLEEIFITFPFSACEQGSALHMCLQVKHWLRVKSVCLILLCLVVISATCRTKISQLASKQFSLQQFDVSDKMFQKGP